MILVLLPHIMPDMAFDLIGSVNHAKLRAEK